MILDTLQFIKLLQSKNEIDIIDAPLSVELEIPHLAYIEVKKPSSKALLFTQPISKTLNKRFEMPVLMNIFGSYSRLELIVNKPITHIATHIENLLKLSPPKGIKAILSKIKEFAYLRHVFPRYTHSRGICQEMIFKGDDINLLNLPILTTWEQDGGAFITMGQVYTQSLDGKQKNLGMYRLQVYDKSHLGLHWQIHKDSQHFFYEYKKNGQKMPVSIALGGDPLYIWCGQAPLPMGIFELMLYGLIRGHKATLCPCVSNPLFVPSDVDIVIEGWVDVECLRDEGPFGDHTGFYTSIEPYPVLEVSAITMRKKAIFPATVVGKPPLEDKYMGYLTERVFLPLLKMSAHGLIDYCMPENGVFHNLIFAKIHPQYPAHAQQIMHNFWGIGQMSFVKHAIFVDENAPNLRDYEALGKYILDRFTPQKMLITEGICDALDHASTNFGISGKLGIEAITKVYKPSFKIIDDKALFDIFSPLYPQARGLKQYFTNTVNPISIVGVEKNTNLLSPIKANPATFAALKDYISIVIFVDFHKNHLENPYMLTWRIVSNIDAKRDIVVIDDIVFVDASDKGECDGYHKTWPLETLCTKSIIESLFQKGLLKGIDERFLERFGILS